MITVAVILWLALALVGIFIYYVRYVEPRSFEVTHLEVRFENLPVGLDGLTITHLSDFHCQPTAGSRFTSAQAVRLANEAGSDLIVVTGDLLDGYDLVEISGPQLKGMTAPLGVWAVLGNHDHYCFYAVGSQMPPEPPVVQLQRSLVEYGLVALSNENRTLSIDGATLALVGCDDVASGNDDLSAAMNGCGAADLTILLAHSPDILDDPDAARADLILCGHTHGGQLRLPGIGSPWAPVWRDRRRSAGLMRADGPLCYVNRGVASATQARFMCRPEVAVITLRRGTMGDVREVPVRRLAAMTDPDV